MGVLDIDGKNDRFNAKTTHNRNRNREDSIMIPTIPRQDETNDVQIKIIKQGKEEKKNQINKNQERKKRKKRAHEGNTQACRLASSAEGVYHRDK